LIILSIAHGVFGEINLFSVIMESDLSFSSADHSWNSFSDEKIVSGI